MTDLESQIIVLIQSNSYMSEELKTRYILALFLMERTEQKDYLKLIEAFNYRCNAIERGVYIVKADEREAVMKTLEDVKKDMLKKINSNQ